MDSLPVLQTNSPNATLLQLCESSMYSNTVNIKDLDFHYFLMNLNEKLSKWAVQQKLRSFYNSVFREFKKIINFQILLPIFFPPFFTGNRCK